MSPLSIKMTSGVYIRADFIYKICHVFDGRFYSVIVTLRNGEMFRFWTGKSEERATRELNRLRMALFPLVMSGGDECE